MSTYTPTWDAPIEILEAGNPSGSACNQNLCLNVDSAKALAALFPQYIATIIMDFPFSLGGPFTFSTTGANGGKVPWFVYTNGAKENAGYVAQVFSHGFPFALALGWALMEIEGTMATVSGN